MQKPISSNETAIPAAIATSALFQPGKITLPKRATKPPVCINLLPSPRGPWLPPPCGHSAERALSHSSQLIQEKLRPDAVACRLRGNAHRGRCHGGGPVRAGGACASRRGGTAALRSRERGARRLRWQESLL